MGFLGGLIDMRKNAPSGDTSGLPPYLQTALGGAGAAGGELSSVSHSGPQDMKSLQGIYDQTLGKAPSGVSESEIRRLYQGAVDSGMQLGSSQIRSSSGERGAAPSSGVERQQAQELGLRVQQPLAETLINAAGNQAKWQQSALGQLFGAASGPSSNSASYRKSGDGGGGAGGGFILPSQASTKFQNAKSDTPWWQTSYGEMNDGEGAKWNAANSGNMAWGNQPVGQNPTPPNEAESYPIPQYSGLKGLYQY